MKKNECIAEALGTFVLVLIGCGAIIINDVYGNVLGALGVSLAFGLAVMFLIYAIGNISGAHINPAVTLCLYFSGALERRVVLPYIISQIFGSILASYVLLLFFPEHQTLGSTLPSVSSFYAFFVEVFLSFLLMFVILSMSIDPIKKRNIAGIIVGSTITLEAFFGGAITGASMNPARSIGPALVSGQTETLWIYILAPIVGMLLAHPSYQLLRENENYRRSL